MARTTVPASQRTGHHRQSTRATVRTETAAPYEARPVPPVGTEENEEYAIERALAILHKRVFSAEDILSRPSDVRQYLCLRLGEQEHESFGCVWLDSQNRVIALEEMFRGTISQASVYPREVVKDALARNAAGVILFHNHPSGLPEPSAADESLTRVICGALKLVDVRVLDHVIVGGTRAMSFAERGLL